MDLVTSILVEVVATMRVGVVEFTGVVWVVGAVWASTLTLYLLLVRMVLFLLSLVFGCGGILILGLVLVGLAMASFVVAGFVVNGSGVGVWI